MTRSRRAALLGLLGSGALLVAETLGVSRTESRRNASIVAVDDADAYVGLRPDADGVRSGGTLFEGAGRQPAPATFAVANQLHDTVTVTIASATENLAFQTVSDGGCPCDGRPSLELPAIDPGTARTVAVSPAEPGAHVTGAFRIRAETADGATTADAERTVALDPAAVAVLTFATHVLVLRWCHRSGSLTLSVFEREGGELRDCTTVPGTPYRRRGWLVVAITSDPSVDAVAASVADSPAGSVSDPGPFRDGESRTNSSPIESTWTAPGVSTAVRDVRPTGSGDSATNGGRPIAVDFGDDGFEAPDPPVVSVTLPADG